MHWVGKGNWTQGVIQGLSLCESLPEGKIKFRKYLFVVEDEFLKPGLHVVKKRIIWGGLCQHPWHRGKVTIDLLDWRAMGDCETVDVCQGETIFSVVLGIQLPFWPSDPGILANTGANWRLWPDLLHSRTIASLCHYLLSRPLAIWWVHVHRMEQEAACLGGESDFQFVGINWGQALFLLPISEARAVKMFECSLEFCKWDAGISGFHILYFMFETGSHYNILTSLRLSG